MLEYHPFLRDGGKRGLKGWWSNKNVGWGGWAPNFGIKLHELKNFEKARTKNIKSYPYDQLSRRNLELVQHIINRGARGDSQTVRARNTGGIINSLKRIRSINNLY